MPSAVTTSTSIVGLPRESRTSRAFSSSMTPDPPAEVPGPTTTDPTCGRSPIPAPSHGRARRARARQGAYSSATYARFTPLSGVFGGSMEGPSTPFALVLTTAGTDEEAQRIARALVEDRLAACVNVAPRITSVYRWKGAVLTETEFLLLIKTRRELF